VAAPTPLSVVCFRRRMSGASAEEEDQANQALMDAANATGEVYLSHTRLGGRLVLRLAVGNIRTEERHVRRAFEILRGAA
jgi:aromatic-L-amino-acid decarboxylase